MLSGTLELTWTNKSKALLSHNDGSYEWVGKRDRRVAEVRLLRDAGTVGEVHPEGMRAKDNLLIRGDALDAMTALSKLPEFADEYVGKIKLAYIDPPFNTGQAFEHYDDGIEHSVWLTMMRDRLVQIKKLLATSGSVWVHLDDAEMAYCKVLLDEIFGRENFVATIVWQKVYAPRNDAKYVSIDHDYILVFAKDKSRLVLNQLERTEEQNALFKNPDNDPRGPWQSDNMTVNKSASERPNLAYDITDPNTGRVFPFNPNRVWAYEQSRMETMLNEGRILFPSSDTGRPRVKRYLNEVSAGRVPQTWWTYDDVGHNQDAKREVMTVTDGGASFATPKPERLLHRVLSIGSDPGDIVLDCFVGSGTTAAVAHKMGRRWVAIERERSTVDTFAGPRVKKVVSGEDDGGVSAIAAWDGGGGFRTLDIAPSMYEEDHGLVVLAQWATSSDLAEAVAAQLGFEFEPDPPFVGKKGRMRLAVLDGHASKDIAKSLVAELDEKSRLTLVATSIEPGLEEAINKLRAGSRAKVAPEDLLLAYSLPSDWRVSVANEEPE